MIETHNKARREWDTNRSAQSCPFCHPRRNISDIMVEVSPLSASTLYLEKIQTYRGHCVLLFDPGHSTRIDELSPDMWASLANDIRASELALMQVFEPDHINIASLGQVVPHLHWHIVPRYIGDPRWGGPIWTTSPDEMKKVYLEPAEYDQLAAAIREALSQHT